MKLNHIPLDFCWLQMRLWHVSLTQKVLNLSDDVVRTFHLHVKILEIFDKGKLSSILVAKLSANLCSVSKSIYLKIYQLLPHKCERKTQRANKQSLMRQTHYYIYIFLFVLNVDDIFSTMTCRALRIFGSLYEK